MRRKVMRFNNEILPALFTSGTHAYRVVESPLPPGTRVVSVKMDNFNHDTVLVLLESDQFDEVPEGEPIPEIRPAMKAL